MKDTPTITLNAIQARTTAESFSRGEKYYKSGAIRQTIRRGDEIQARCDGSGGRSYRVQAHLKADRVVATGCTCEYDWGGDCKHIVALLLTWLRHPERFEQRAAWHETLAQLSTDELIDIISLMVARYPDLQDIVDRPTPSAIIQGAAQLDTEAYRQTLREAFSSYSYDDYEGDEEGNTPEQAVLEVAVLAERFSRRGQWPHAAALYRVILEAFAEIKDDYFDREDEDLPDAIASVITELENCLKQPVILNDDTERRASLNALLGMFLWDVNMGGINVGGNASEIILRHLHREDIADIRQAVEAARDQHGSRWSRQWVLERLGEFLIELDTLDEVDPAVILERLRAQGLYLMLTQKLLEMGRVDQAADVVRHEMNNRHEWQQALDIFVDYGHGEKAEQIAEGLLMTAYHDDLAGWLVRRYQATDNKPSLLRWQRRQMQENPSLPHYIALKATAQALHEWEALRPQLLHALQAQQVYDLLTRVYLHDENWEMAWKTLPKTQNQRTPLTGRTLDFEVAEASHHVMPAQAIPVYVRHARQAIDRRHRSHYATAADLLAVVRKLYHQLGQPEQWTTLIAGIRHEFRTLRAFQHELDKAGL